jgi:hypothetical protein
VVLDVSKLVPGEYRLAVVVARRGTTAARSTTTILVE